MPDKATDSKHFKVIYREPTEEMAPSAINIDGEGVWAEIGRDSDLTFTYVTRDLHGISHIWIAWVTDDPEVKEFHVVIPISDDGENPINFKTYGSALRAAAELSACRP
jgi:hypothetical protein